MKQQLSLLALSLSLLLPINLLAFQSPENIPSRRPIITPSTSTSISPIVFPNFEFTPHGICTNPRHFVDSQSRQWFTLRNVPGEGDCMFLAVLAAAAATKITTTTSSSVPSPVTITSNARIPFNMPHQDPLEHQNDPNHSLWTENDVKDQDNPLHDFLLPTLSSEDLSNLRVDDPYWRVLAQSTRDTVAHVLESHRGTLYIGKNRPWVSTKDLLRSATRQEGLASPRQYLQALRTLGRQGGLYGGGPELTVLSNLLRRPIAIYEMSASNDISSSSTTTIIRDGICPIVCKGIFGDGLFDAPPFTATATTTTTASPTTRNGGGGGGQWENWRINVLVVDASPLEKHACVLLPLPKQQTKLP